MAWVRLIKPFTWPRGGQWHTRFEPGDHNLVHDGAKVAVAEGFGTKIKAPPRAQPADLVGDD